MRTKLKTKSGKRNQAEGFVDRIAGRILEAWGALTGNNKARAKGGAARGRGGVAAGGLQRDPGPLRFPLSRSADRVGAASRRRRR
jgi:uncharacterized protein YjbJ (UPF0337 family)